ncbi:hypothetical protein NDN08_003768 [Rhodosorus marinus]|uniref:ribonuclease P n=1 Tax=Rhodosorus marinus TaxID=101924 RepID=A0AAV8UGF6_9RHOD|nr:hypothetical protein NDN08_003768 [Rhodosorus marinus]
MGKKRKRQTAENGNLTRFHEAVAKGNGSTAVELLESLHSERKVTPTQLTSALSALGRESKDDSKLSWKGALSLADKAVEMVNGGRSVLGEPGFTALVKITALAGIEENDSSYADKVRALISEMRQRKITIKKRTYASLVSILCGLKLTEQVKNVITEASNDKVELDEESYSCIVAYLTDNETEESVWEVLDKFRHQNRTVSEQMAESGSALDRFFSKHGTETMVVKRIRKDGTCPHCQIKLDSVDLTKEQIDQMISQVEDYFFVSEEQKLALQGLATWLKDLDSNLDCVIDGANVGFFMQRPDLGGVLSFAQIQLAVDACRANDFKHVVVFLHEKRAIGPEVDKLRESCRVYLTPRRMNDDWFWLYAALLPLRQGSKAFVLSNDQMRDHVFRSLTESAFLRWRERHLIEYSISKVNKFRLQIPSVYSRDVQKSRSNERFWHFPIREGENESSSTSWLCCAAPLK